MNLDPFDAVLDALSESRYDDGQPDAEPDLRDDPGYWNGAEERDS